MAQVLFPQTSIQAEGKKNGELPSSNDRCQGEGAISWTPVQRPESPFLPCAPLSKTRRYSALLWFLPVYFHYFSLFTFYQRSIFLARA